jgi:antitoxin YefM
MDKVNEDRSPLLVTRRGRKPVIVLALEEYEGMEETLHLMRSPANARHLLSSIRALERGEGKERALIEPKTLAQPKTLAEPKRPGKARSKRPRRRIRR